MDKIRRISSCHCGKCATPTEGKKATKKTPNKGHSQSGRDRSTVSPRYKQSVWLRPSLRHASERDYPIETFNVGVSPSSLAVTSDGHYGYVTNANNLGIAGSDSVTVLDFIKGVPLTTIVDASFEEPWRIAIDRKNQFAYVTNSASPVTATPSGGTVSVLDIQKGRNQVVGLISGFDGPGDIVLHPSKPLAYVSNYGAAGGAQSGHGHTVSVVDLIHRQIIHTIDVPQAPAALQLSKRGDTLYVLSYVDGLPTTGRLTTVSTETLTVTQSLNGFFGPFCFVLSPCGRYAYVTNFGSNNFQPYGTTLSIVSLPENRIVKTIRLGIQPSGVAISPCGNKLYVSNYNALYAGPAYQNLTYGQGTVNIICLKTFEVQRPTLVVGQTPATLTMSPDGHYLFVCKYEQNTVSSIRLP